MVNITHTLSHMEPKEQAAQLPEKRGVYMFKDAVDQVIYVGKVR
jgi:excinuclease UvrABC nuclease subunit